MVKMNMSCFLWAVLIVIILCSSYLGEGKKLDTTPTPTPWPEQFHSLLYINNSGSLQVTDLWYDWSNGRNFNIIQKQLGRKLYDLELDSGTSFYYYLDKDECKTMHFDVGILRPNWLEGAKYLGMKYVDGFLCNGWEKVDFIWYYEDALTNRPVYWRFFSGMSVHVMTFEVGAVLEDAEWQAPMYCFDKVGAVEDPKEKAKANPVEGYAPLYPYFHKRLLSGFNEHNIFTIDS